MGRTRLSSSIHLHILSPWHLLLRVVMGVCMNLSLAYLILLEYKYKYTGCRCCKPWK